MRQWFQSLALRERVTLTAGAAAALGIVLWGLVWQPMIERRAELRESVDQKSRLLVDLQRSAAVTEPAGEGAARSGAEQSILLVIDGAARTFGLAESFTQTRPNGPNEISVSFQRAPFDTIVAWLIELESAYGISVDSASITSAGLPGLVNGQIFLARG